MKPARQLFDKIVQKADLDAEIRPGQPLLEMLGNFRVIIENHRGVTSYQTGEIRVRVKCGLYLVCGVGLRIAQMTNTALVIVGKITSVQFCGGK